MACNRSSDACGNSTLSSRLNWSFSSWKSTFRSRRQSFTLATACTGFTYSMELKVWSLLFMRTRRVSFFSKTPCACLTSSFVWQLVEPFQSGQCSAMQWLCKPRSSTGLNHFPVSFPIGPLPVTDTMNLWRSAICSSVWKRDGFSTFSSMRPARTCKSWRLRSLCLSFWMRGSAMVDWFHGRGSVPRMLACFDLMTAFFASSTSGLTSLL
mmetsp:Transcript_77342/g.151762  ORF Transcript_77342/g.151762 Transcript_77342/m.151762 type:complete len:210 (+) Transcript_77342:469-1098(+)